MIIFLFVKSPFSNLCSLSVCHLVTMNENTNPSIRMHPNIDTTLPIDFGNGSYVEFPPLEWKDTNGASSSAQGVDILNNILAANGDAIIPNTEMENQHNLKPPLKGNRASYASLFKYNRRARSDFKLDKVDVSSSIPEFGIENIDSVEQTYVICLLGYVISGKPPLAALFDLVKRWGSSIQFQTHDSGLIIFRFPSVEVRS